jgi:hypothetical protein
MPDYVTAFLRWRYGIIKRMPEVSEAEKSAGLKWMKGNGYAKQLNKGELRFTNKCDEWFVTNAPCDTVFVSNDKT